MAQDSVGMATDGDSSYESVEGAAPNAAPSPRDTPESFSRQNSENRDKTFRKLKIDKIEEILEKLKKPIGSSSGEVDARSRVKTKGLPGLKKSERLGLTNKLRQLCITRFGLVSTELRQKVWPIIFGIDVEKLPAKPNRKEVRENQWYNQVKLDVDRSASRIPSNLSAEQKDNMQEQLTDLILHILCKNPDLHYYQGYHDITITILQVCGLRLAMPVAEKLTTEYLKDFMQQTMDSTRIVLDMIFPLINELDPELLCFLKDSEVGSYFALSWLLTWYGHVIKDLKRTCRVYDFFIASHPAMPIYLAAEIILHRREEILSTECDMPSVHHLLTSLASKQLPDDELIENAVLVFIEKPPSNIAIENDELKIYKDLFMAKQQESSPSLFDALDLSPNSGSSSNGVDIVTDINRNLLKLRINESPDGPLREGSFIVRRRNELLKKQRSSYRRRTMTEASANNPAPRGFAKRALRFVGVSGVAAIAVAVISFWIQHANEFT